MGLFSGIGSMFKKIASGIGNVVSGVMKFAKSPFGQLLINVGLSLVTGGTGGILMKALGAVGKFGNIGGLFAGFASKFLGPATSLLSESGLGGLVSFASKATNTSDLLGIATSLMGARKENPQPELDGSIQDMANYNIMQMLAYQQAQVSA